METQNLTLSKTALFKSFVITNANLVILFAVLVVSTVSAPIFISSSVINSFFVSLSEFFIGVKTSFSYVNIFLLTIVAYFPFSVAAFICGFSALGFVFSVAVCCVLGFCNGAYSAVFCSLFSYTGYNYFLTSILPTMFVATAGIILSLRESFVFSTMIAKSFSKSGKQYNFYIDLKLYSMRFLFSVAFLFAAGAINSLLTFLFFSKYTF